MPFDTPATYTAIEDGTYVLQLKALEDTPDNGFGPGNKWIFHLWEKQTREAVTNEDGTAYEFYQFSSSKMTPRAKARGWFEALIGRPIQDGEDPDAIVSAAIGKYAEALIASEIEDGKLRTKIVTMKPMQAKANGKVEPPNPAPTPQPVQQLNDDAGGIPWE